MQGDIRDLIGIPFVDRGRSLSGMDCYGLAREAMRRFGYDVPDMPVSCGDALAAHAEYEAQRPLWTPVSLPDPGDLCAMSLDLQHPELIQHVGVFVGSGRILHTMLGRDSHLIKIDDPLWSRKIRGWYRWSA